MSSSQGKDSISPGKAAQKRDGVLKDYNWGIVTKGTLDEEAKDGPETVSHRMDAIAAGVEIRYDLVTGLSTRVIEETAAIAQELGIPDDVTQRWVMYQLTCHTEKVRRINAWLHKDVRRRANKLSSPVAKRKSLATAAQK